MANKAIYEKFAVTDAGDVIPGAEYTVINENTGTALTIYSSRTGAAKSPPYFADASGLIQFYVDPITTFRVAVTGPTGTFTSRYNQGLLVDELYTEANLNVNEFGGVGSNQVIAIGTAVNSTSLRFYLPCSFFNKPTSVTIDNVFTVREPNGAVVESGLISGNFSLSTANTNKLCCLVATVSGGLVVGGTYELLTGNSTSKITVSP